MRNLGMYFPSSTYLSALHFGLERGVDHRDKENVAKSFSPGA